VRAVDTNVLVRLVARDDVKQVRQAEAFVAPGAWVPQIVLVEAMWVLRAVYGRAPAEIAVAIEMLLNHEQLTIQDSEVVSAAVDRFRRRPGLGFSDCLVLEVSRKAGHVPLGTFDRTFSKLDDVVAL
jgi:predicted nucleic-acid-binding protein